MKVRLGKNASVFHDPYSGVTVKPGKVVEISSLQARTRKIRDAINGGCLVVATSEEAPKKQVVNKTPDATPEELRKSFDSMVEADTNTEDLLNVFNKKELAAIAGTYEIEVEKEDTKNSILSALLEAYDEANAAE